MSNLKIPTKVKLKIHINTYLKTFVNDNYHSKVIIAKLIN